MFSQLGTLVVTTAKKTIIIKFKEFKNYWIIAPSNWHLYENKAEYIKPKYEEECPRYSYPDSFYFKFTLIDAIKYKSFYKNYKKEKEKRISNKKYVKFLSYIQKDINKAKEEANKNINEGIEMLNTYLSSKGE